jgi:hypothetical protein
MSVELAFGLLAATMVVVIILYKRGEPREEPRDAAAQALISREELARLGVPSVVLTGTSNLTFSKIGGAPDLPADLAWPSGEKGPRKFLVQIDLAEARSWSGPEWLPGAGRIYVFHDEERAGFADHACVLFSDGAPGAAQSFTAPPHPERRLTGRAYTCFPSPDWLGVDGTDCEDDELAEFVIEPEPVGRQGVHRMGGFPSEIQSGQMNVECEYLARSLEMNHQNPIPDEIREAAKSWRMLLQIDSDRDLKMNWWDSGRFYIFIREQDARAGDFSKTVTISQTY